ncbi:hypothetical protein BC833DRAFT_625165 [Globomyces pollinis-pini]|nr:hypothetical protein BC833DRAFT_625165 [Globomyces pollinis-pini]
MFKIFENPGNTLIATGILHLITGFVLKPISIPLVNLLKKGWFLQLGGIDDALSITDYSNLNYDQQFAFWFQLGGIQFILLGEAIKQLLKLNGKIPKVLSWGLIGFGLFGTATDPVSGFPLLVGIGIWMLNFKSNQKQK